MVVFAARYGYSPLIVMLHVAQVASWCVAVGMLLHGIGIVAGRRAPVLARSMVTLLGAGASSLYLIVLIGSAVTNEAWGWSVSVDLAREYASSVPAIIGNLPFSRAWLYAGGLLYAAAQSAMLFGWWLASPSFVAPGTATSLEHPGRAIGRARGGAVRSFLPFAGVLLAVIFVLVARSSARAAPEPFTALLTAPGLPDPHEARARNARARREYALRAATFDHRNVILIFSDALRADHTSVYGYRRRTTPFLDRLAATGQLRRVKLALSTCSFTACGVLSTLASRDTGVLEPGSLKLHDVLHDRGYRVHFIASTDNSSWYTLRLHYGSTVDYFFDGFNSKRFPLNDDRSIVEGLDAVPDASGPAFFFFFLSSTTSLGTRHGEFQRWIPAAVDLGSDPQAVQSLMNAYDNGILEADHTIETIFQRLDQKGYLTNSLVVILGDHGEGFGEHGHFAHTKYLYQEVLHIPLLIYDESAVTYRNLDFASQSDVAPTILDRLGLPIPATWQGRSLLSEPPKTFSTHWTDRGRPWYAVVYRDGGKVYKYLYQSRWGTLVEELYELRSDPTERRNLMLSAGAPAGVLSAVRRKAAETFPTTSR